MKKIISLLLAGFMAMCLFGCSAKTEPEPEMEPVGYSEPYYIFSRSGKSFEKLEDLATEKIGYQSYYDKEDTDWILNHLMEAGVPEENFIDCGDYKSITYGYFDNDFDVWIMSKSANELVCDFVDEYKSVAYNTVAEIEVPYYEEKTADTSKENDELFTKPFMVMCNGLDERVDPDQNSKARNDVNCLMVVDPVRKHITTVSFPRDTFLYMPSLGWSAKLCEIGTYSDNEGIREAISNVLDIEEIPYFVQVSFSSFIDTITNLGGIYVDVPLDMTMDQNSYRDVSKPTSLEKGYQKLWGEWALALARNRKYNGIYNGDYGRIRNQALIIDSLIAKIANNTEVLVWSEMIWRAKVLSYTNFSDDQIDTLIKLADRFAEGYTVDNYFIVNADGTSDNGASIGLAQWYSLQIAKGKIELALTGKIAEDANYYDDILEGYVTKGASTKGYEGESYDLREIYGIAKTNSDESVGNVADGSSN